jgi:hypothetical protein
MNGCVVKLWPADTTGRVFFSLWQILFRQVRAIHLALSLRIHGVSACICNNVGGMPIFGFIEWHAPQLVYIRASRRELRMKIAVIARAINGITRYTPQKGHFSWVELSKSDWNSTRVCHKLIKSDKLYTEIKRWAQVRNPIRLSVHFHSEG